jgi:hypothetical protein
MFAETKKKFRDYKNYGIITALSLFAIFFLPMIGSTTDLGWKLPYTFVGWVVWILTKALVALLNIMLFHSFMEQAKVNVKDNPYYVEANEILMRYGKILKMEPRDPETWERGEYKNKGTTIALTTVLSAIGLTQAVLTFNWLDMLSYTFTVAMGIIFGLLQMDKAELYWTTEYWQYAKKVEREILTAQGKVFNETDVFTLPVRGAAVLEPVYNNNTDSNIPSTDVDGSGRDIRSVGMGPPGDSNSNSLYNNV